MIKLLISTIQVICLLSLWKAELQVVLSCNHNQLVIKTSYIECVQHKVLMQDHFGYGEFGTTVRWSPSVCCS